MARLALRKCLEGFPEDKTVHIWKYISMRSKELGGRVSEDSSERRMEIIKELSVFAGDAAVELIFCLECPDDNVPDEIVDRVRTHLMHYWG